MTEFVSRPRVVIEPAFSLVLSIIFGCEDDVVAKFVSANRGVTAALLEERVYEPPPSGVIDIVTFAPLRLNVFAYAALDGVKARPVRLLIATAESSVKPNLFEALSFPATAEFPKILNCAAEILPSEADICNFLFESK